MACFVTVLQVLKMQRLGGGDSRREGNVERKTKAGLRVNFTTYDSTV